MGELQQTIHRDVVYFSVSNLDLLKIDVNW